MNDGRHIIGVELVKNLSDLEARILHCVAFKTVDDHRIHSAYGKWGGSMKPEFEWKSERIGDVERTRC